MNAPRQSSRVLMLRPDLTGLPEPKWPAGWQLRPYESGFERHWLEIHLAAEKQLAISPESFRHVFGNDPAPLRDRQRYLFDETGRAVGTVTAWFGPDFPEKTCGRVHYLAVVPEFQRRGLGKSLLVEALRLLKRLGYATAYLATSNTRLPAIRLYLELGFQPVRRSAQDREIWEEILAECSASRNQG